jgi:hypothetical protein
MFQYDIRRSRLYQVFVSISILMGAFIGTAFPQEKFLSIQDFKEPLGEWYGTGNAKLASEDEKRLESTPGAGVFINGKDGRTVHLITTEHHGDVKLWLEFMVSKESNSGVYLQGRYEIQILDSWGKTKWGSGDCGGLYQRWDESQKEDKGYDGIPPLVNASKPPGEWQTFYIHFKAPRFNAEGKKKKNAMFRKVELNGILIHKNVEATGPTRASLDDLEEPHGPLMLQGDHGPVAYRNIRITK